MRLKKGTYKEIGKHFLTIGAVSLSVGIITPLLQEGKFKVIMIAGSMMWFLFFVLGVYFINKGKMMDSYVFYFIGVLSFVFLVGLIIAVFT